jgi:two-component system, chemotaxis family, protein-glutamate methylesterase/glutaminase
MAQKKEHKRRVYIADAHVLMRQIISGILRNMDNVADVKQAGSIDRHRILREIGEFNPELIFLGVESSHSPEMNIFEMLRKHYPDIPVVLVTPLDSEGADAALTGLKLGAVDYLTKPCRSNNIVLAANHFYKRIVPIVKNLSGINRRILTDETAFSIDNEPDVQHIYDASMKIKQSAVELVAIGGCLGAVRSLYSLMKHLPAELPAPVVIIQHMPKIYTRRLAEELDKISPLHVREAGDNSLLLPGQVYLAPGGYHTVVKTDGNRRMLAVHRGPREHKFRPSIDVFLRSAVKSYNNQILGVILSGAANDGILGARQLVESNGLVFVENEVSALFSKLPKEIENLDLAAGKYSADELSKEITKAILVKRQGRGYRKTGKSTSY